MNLQILSIYNEVTTEQQKSFYDWLIEKSMPEIVATGFVYKEKDIFCPVEQIFAVLIAAKFYGFSVLVF